MTRHMTCLIGALVADAASLGLHWIYDTGRIAEIAGRQGGRVAFTPIEPANFEGVPAYFAHAARRDGMQTQYGEVLRLAIDSLIASDGAFDVSAYQTAFAGTFGPGGSYHGYIDAPTRGTLANIAAGQLDPSGIDDDQLPAIATLPAIAVAHAADHDYAERVQSAIRVTNVNSDAAAYGLVAARLLARVLQGAPVAQALRDTAQDSALQPLVDALDSPEPSSVAYGDVTKRACHLSMGMPLAFHIMARATGYADAVETNIRAGGDSAGRSILIGAIMGAAHGLGGDQGIPPEWLMRLQGGHRIWQACEQLPSLRN